MSAVSTSCCNCYGSSRQCRWRDARTILLTNWCYTKMASGEIIIICILYLIVWSYFVQNIIKLVNECWRYSKPNQCHFWAWLKRPIFRVLDSKGSAETLVRRGGITNYHLITYLFSNISAKNYQYRLMCIEVIAYNVIDVLFETQCISMT